MSTVHLRYAMVFALVFASFSLAHAQTETVLYKFKGTRDGVNTSAGLVAGSNGSLYGTTQVGGSGYGTVYELAPNGSGGWNETTLHSFNLAGGDGCVC